MSLGTRSVAVNASETWPVNHFPDCKLVFASRYLAGIAARLPFRAFPMIAVQGGVRVGPRTKVGLLSPEFLAHWPFPAANNGNSGYGFSGFVDVVQWG
jgi:hypothetical protein